MTHYLYVRTPVGFSSYLPIWHSTVLSLDVASYSQPPSSLRAKVFNFVLRGKQAQRFLDAVLEKELLDPLSITMGLIL